MSMVITRQPMKGRLVSKNVLNVFTHSRTQGSLSEQDSVRYRQI